MNSYEQIIGVYKQLDGGHLVFVKPIFIIIPNAQQLYLRIYLLLWVNFKNGN